MAKWYWFLCGRFFADPEVLLRRLKEKAGTKMPDKKIKMMCLAIADRDKTLGLEALSVVREKRPTLAWNIENSKEWFNSKAG